MTRKRAAAQRMRRAARQPGITPLLVPDIRFGARQCSERDLHWCSPTRRRTATRRRKLSGVPPAVATGQRCGPGPPLHIKTDSRLWLLCRARHKSHGRRNFFKLAQLAKAPLAIEAVRRIDAIFDLERTINGQPREQRQATRQDKIAPLVADLEGWMRDVRRTMSRHADVAKAIDYMLKRWASFSRFLDDGRICLTNNAAERALRGIALGRKAWLFAGSDRGGERAAAVYSLIVSAKLNDVDPRAWLAGVLARIADHPASRLHELLPWHWPRLIGDRNLAA